MKCHLCGSYLTEGPASWNVGGRALHEYKCLDKKCSAIRVNNRCMIGLIIPDNDIVSYQLIVSYHEQWYRIWGRKNSEHDSETTLSRIYLSTPERPAGSEMVIFTLPRYYELNVKDDFLAKAQEFLDKFKRLVPFI